MTCAGVYSRKAVRRTSGVVRLVAGGGRQRDGEPNVELTLWKLTVAASLSLAPSIPV